MRLIVCFILTCCTSPALTQGNYGEFVVTGSNQYDENDYRRRYPYVKGYSPSFVGIVAGYNFLNSQEAELGLSYNMSSGLKKFGMTGGYQLIYRRAIEREQNAVDVELGVYGIVAMGMGVNYNFSKEGSAFGFKPFIGTSIYHFQLLYGYNFLRKEKQEWYQLNRHSLTLRYVIPLKASSETVYYPRPAPEYRNLQGMNKNHPLKNERYPSGCGYDNWNEFRY